MSDHQHHFAAKCGGVYRTVVLAEHYDALRTEVEKLRQIEAIARRCAHNGGYISSAQLIELRELLRATARRNSD